MKSRNLRNRIGGALMAFSLVGGIALASSTKAQAQYPNGRNDRYERDRDGDGRGRHARRDRDHDRDGNRDRDYRYRRNNDRYSRNGGYGRNDGYNGGYNNGGYNNGGYNNGGYNNNVYRAEMSQGYQAGLNTGASDAQRGQSFNPQRSHYYKDASTQAFREGFVQGYDQGYRQYAGYNNGGYRRRNTGNLGNILGGIFGGY
jgi:hypothetical protein